MLSPQLQKNLRHNFTVNVLDGTFFGFALGIASFVTVIPLFVATLTDSTTLIGLIASIHMIGWQLPQLLTADRVARLRRYRPMVVFMTFHERWPFIAMGVVALLVSHIGRELALLFTFLLVSWQAFGGGFTATAWQSMISKIMPGNIRGTFFGIQSSAANLMASGGAILAGLLLSGIAYPNNYAVLFLIAGVSMMISLGFLAATREPESERIEDNPKRNWREFWTHLWNILKRDANFRWFVFARFMAQFATMAMAFFTIYAVRRHEMSPETAGVMTGLLMLSQTVGSPIAGWAGDHFGHRRVFAVGNVLMAFSAFLALTAPDLNAFGFVFILSGFVNAAQWTTVLAMTADFGAEMERPFYIGLSNTMVAPATLISPILGGWLADTVGFEATFGVCVFTGLLAAAVLQFLVFDPIVHKRKIVPSTPASAIETC